MLTIFGRSHGGYCDGISRRGFLKIGGFAFGSCALSLPQVLAGQGSRHKALIHIYLGGGPPHQDMWDLKMEAPAEIRGEFKPIATRVPGIEICEVFPQLAALMDKAAIIRSVVGMPDRHEPHTCHTGWTVDSLRALGGRPAIGSAVAKLQGPVDRTVPPFVGLAHATRHGPWADPGHPGFLGSPFSAYTPDGPGLSNMRLRGISLDQLGDRRRLLQSFDQLRREVDANGSVAGVDTNTALAFDVLTSSKLVDALDLSKEDPRIRDRYGNGKPYQFQYDGAPTVNDQLLIARRLVEAGVRVVTLTYGRWDSHGENFKLVRDHGAKLDQCLSALIEDLDARGMLDDVAIIAWGEFGRTPRINGGAGRDHWPAVAGAFLAGGGIRAGQVIGSTNRLGEHAKDRPVHFQEVVATLYHALGVDPATTTISDPTGRPQYLTERLPMKELV